jgi:D-3-phosphoglycerate dehydrogenase / 2-oxoglutarate reductase
MTGVVAVTDHVFAHLDVERELLESSGWELRFTSNARSVDEVRAATAGAVGVLNCYAPMPAEVIASLDRCRVIARYGIGLDTIDLPAATAKGIVVTNVPDYCIDEVSDHAMALMLSIARGVVRLDRSVHAGSWSPADARPLHRIPGRTLGLVGFGRIARRVAVKAAAFGFRIIATDPFVPGDAMRDAGVEPRELGALLSESDVVSIHAPLTDTSRYLIGAPELARMKQGAILVNTSRGGLVDTAALRDALAAGSLGGAGLDVLETEPLDIDDPLLRRSDVVVTPHASFYSEESVAELQRKAAEQVVAALSGDRPPYAVNADELTPPGS